ncbi:hypothetical protein, partial [Paenibacillus chitinolyticus]|uniref:hypothetical protein n=1 Tax=Paenibacillus chitinolyticus TaxID=79263 RepID=UPI00366EADD8
QQKSTKITTNPPANDLKRNPRQGGTDQSSGSGGCSNNRHRASATGLCSKGVALVPAAVHEREPTREQARPERDDELQPNLTK